MKSIPQDIAKTSMPQTWHIPRQDKISGMSVPEIKVSGYKSDGEDRPVKSTLYNPIRSTLPPLEPFVSSLELNHPDLSLLTTVPQTDEPAPPFVRTNFGLFPKGSTISHQQRIIIIKFQNQRSLQKDRSSSRTVLTEATREPFAVEAYGKLKEGSVNIYPCGIVISPRAAWMAASPDRKELDPSSNPPSGLLEVKCPDLRNKDLRDLQYFSLKDNGQLALKATCNYYHQVQMQLAMTRLKWCDFFVWSERQHHLERIDFCPESWQRMKDKADKFFFDYLLS